MAMNPKGTIRKDGITHRVYEAVLTHPNRKFKASDIWQSLHKDYPEIKKPTVSSLLTNKKSLVRELVNDLGKEKGKRIYERKNDPPIRHIFDPEEQNFKEAKRLPPKPQPIPETVTDYQIGQSIILYIEKLKKKVREMATAYGDIQNKSKSEMRRLEMELNSKNHTIKTLQDEIKVLRVRKDTHARTFSMSEVSRFNGK